MAGIYIHIPYCSKACHYCDFHFSTYLKSKKDMVNAIVQEVDLRSGYLRGGLIETIYFGGGTPSLLTVKELSLILSSVREHFEVAETSEITLEANPDDITEGFLETILDLGINRLSLGTQSFHDPHLKMLNRSHNSQQSIRSLELLGEIGVSNYSADLIYAIPYIDHFVWKEDIERMLSFSPPHLSCYNLTVEEKTVLGKWVKSGRFKEVDDDFAYTQLDLLMDTLSANGYDQYEISNFSKPGFESRHNSNYWNDHKYLGLGPGAHSYDHVSRQYNISNNALYIKGITSGKVLAKSEELSKTDKINESILTQIRTSRGVNLSSLKTKFGYDLLKEQNTEIENLVDNNLLESDNQYLKLTRQGKFLADKITEDLFIA